MNKSKKIISVLAAATLAFSSLALTGCGAKKYAGEKLTAIDSMEEVTSNGGFAVETKDYVYFINGTQVNTADNTYGDVTKGALMRISKAELAAENYDAAQIIVPSLFVAGDYNAGVYIYNGYVYYATPTTDRNTKTGQIENSYLDFKYSKLDGSEAPSNYFLRLSSNSAKYRFVEVDGVVYCMYEEGGALKSYNVNGEDKGTTTVLVSGAKSSFFYDLKDPTNPNVYYTMGVTYDLDKTTQTSAQYDQVYCVNAAATAVADKNTASYKVFNGDKEIASYDFDEKFLKENDKYNLSDYTTYPYVNLGSLVLDGVGSAPSPSNDNRFNKDDKADSSEVLGYNYTIQSYQNDGLYFTRKALTTTTSDTADAKLYYLADDKGDNWNTITGNTKADIVALDTTNASTSALFEVAEDGTHSYIYHSGSILKKATADENGVATEITLAKGVSSATLWKTEGAYLYYYASATNGNNITRINYKGSAEKYNALLATEEYKPVTLPLVDWNSAWYKPEIVTLANGEQIVLYANAKAYGAGSTAYNYIYAAKLGTTKAILDRQEEIDEVNEFITSYTENAPLQAVMNYYYKTGEKAAYEAVIDLYDEYQQGEFTAFVEKFAENGEFAGMMESAYVAPISRMTKADTDAIYDNWASSLLSEKVVEEDNSLPTWAIVLIIVGGVLVVAAGVTIPLVITAKKKEAKRKEAEAIVTAYKRKKIDTTDDKTIDVYADEEATEEVTEETAEEAAEEVVEETTEEVVEEVAEETTETVEETTEEVVEETVEEVATETTEESSEE